MLLSSHRDCLISRLLLLVLVPSPPSPTHPETHKTSYHQCHLPLHLLPTQAIQAALLGRVIMNSPRALFSFWKAVCPPSPPNTQLRNLKEDVSQETALLHSVRKTALKVKLLTGEKFLPWTPEKLVYKSIWTTPLQHLTRRCSSRPHWEPHLCSVHSPFLNHKSTLTGLQHSPLQLLTAIKLQPPCERLFPFQNVKTCQ